MRREGMVLGLWAPTEPRGVTQACHSLVLFAIKALPSLSGPANCE